MADCLEGGLFGKFVYSWGFIVQLICGGVIYVRCKTANVRISDIVDHDENNIGFLRIFSAIKPPATTGKRTHRTGASEGN
jgi:hypothetical protein